MPLNKHLIQMPGFQLVTYTQSTGYIEEKLLPDKDNIMFDTCIFYNPQL